MQTKTDVGQLLTESFKKLALKTPIEKITIKEITDEAGVIRPTFYHHFQDKYEVVEQIIQNEILTPAKPLLQNHMIDEAIVLIFTNLQKEKEFYVMLSKMQGQNSFEQIVDGQLQQVLLEFFSENTEGRKAKKPWLTPQLLAMYYAQSMGFVLLQWIAQGMPGTPKEMAEIYNYIITRSMWDVVDEFE
ncbi:MAG: TetR/AcrR family transcriptional regulator C-terminal domain-containing protein [Lachnospiraceae bacterium]|nr:TetR/AcrR family transcriptional regulator C-terminal domain-containing protein [Lachnospiraceae bacterium]